MMGKGSKYTKYLEWLVMLLCFVGIIYFHKIMDLDKDLKPTTTNESIVYYVGIFFMTFIVLGVHELGHLIAGLVNGFKFQLYVVGPLGIKREDDKIKVYLNKNLGYYGGIAATTPTTYSDDNAKKFARILLAGPIASLVFCLICFVMAMVLGRPLGFIFYVGAFISFGIFVVTTVPSRTGMFFTDRKRYQRLITPGKGQDAELAMLSIMGKFSMDNSYKNIERKELDVLISDELPFIKYYGLYNLKCYQLEMTGQVEENISLAYENVSKEIPKNVVANFDKEFEKFKSELEQ